MKYGHADSRSNLLCLMATANKIAGAWGWPQTDRCWRAKNARIVTFTLRKCWWRGAGLPLRQALLLVVRPETVSDFPHLWPVTLYIRRVVVNRLSCGLASLLLLSVGLPVANAPDVLQPYYFLDVPTFTTSRLPRDILVAKGGTIWSRNGRWILPEMPDFHVAFRNLLHTVNLRHQTDGFTSPPKEGVLRIFSPWKIRRLRPGLNPRTWVPKASTPRHITLVIAGCWSGARL